MFLSTRNIRPLYKLIIVFLLLGPMVVSADPSERDHYISLLEETLNLNNALKIAVKNESEDYLGIRNRLESHVEEELLPCLPLMAKFILENEDYELYADLLSLLVSASNIADEGIYSAVEKVFSENHDLFMQATKRLERGIVNDLQRLYGLGKNDQG